MWSSFPICKHCSKSDADITGNHYSQASDTFVPATKQNWDNSTLPELLIPYTIPELTVSSEWNCSVKQAKFCRSFLSNQTKEKVICNYVNYLAHLWEKWCHQSAFSSSRGNGWRQSICRIGTSQQMRYWENCNEHENNASICSVPFNTK